VKMDWAYILASAGGIFSGFKAVTFVREGERGILLTFGKAKRSKDGKVKLWGPGFRPMIPFVQRVEKIHMQKNTLNFPNFTVTLKNNLSYIFSGYIVYHIMDTPDWVEHALFRLEDVDAFVTVNFEQAVQKVMWKMDELELDGVDDKLLTQVNRILKKNGIEAEQCGVTGLTETPVSQSFRGVDYRIQKALEFKDQLSECILAAAIGATPTVATGECPQSYGVTNTEE